MVLKLALQSKALMAPALAAGKNFAVARDKGAREKFALLRKNSAAPIRAAEGSAPAGASAAFRAARESAPDGQFARLQSRHIPLHHERCSYNFAT